MLSHAFGWELHLRLDGEMARTVTCRSQEEVLNAQAAWRTELEARGWGRAAIQNNDSGVTE